MQISAKNVTDANNKNILILKVNKMGGKVFFDKKDGMIVEIEGSKNVKEIKNIIKELEN